MYMWRRLGRKLYNIFLERKNNMTVSGKKLRSKKGISRGLSDHVTAIFTLAFYFYGQ